MNIFNFKPREVVCVRNDRNVIGDKEHNHLLKIGKVYNVEDIDIHSWHTDVYLVEFPGVPFSSVLFEEKDGDTNG